MVRSTLFLAAVIAGFTTISPLSAQQLQPWRFSAVQLAPRALASVSIPDSVRVKAGYQHWKGAAIGGTLGALGGLFLALAAGGQCDDCTSDVAPAGQVTLIGAGLGGAFGFLVGLASPRYRWVAADPE